MTERTNHRTLEQIGYELSYTLRDQTTGKLIVGSLLNEAKELIEHGDWLPFLKLYRIEARSAQNYMKVKGDARQSTAAVDNGANGWPSGRTLRAGELPTLKLPVRH
jgi:hypothetical protein